MKLIVLAAGEGTRLRPLTNSTPKCMVALDGKPLLERQLETAKQVGIEDVHVVGGYREDMIDYPGITKHTNQEYAATNMVTSLFCAEEALEGDVIISYGDIVYQPDVIQSLMNSSAEVSVVVDRSWKSYWSARMEDPLKDAETLRMDVDGNIVELGKRATSYDQIEGQYIGLIKIKGSSWPTIRSYYEGLDRSAQYERREFDEMYMTTFLQLIADHVMPIKAVLVSNGWIEIDEPSDLEFTRFLYRESK